MPLLQGLFKYLSIIILMVYFPSWDYAQTIIRGKVTSGDTSSVSGSSIRVAGSKAGVAADTLGDYMLKTNLHGKHWLFCSAVGYKTDSVLCDIYGDTVSINFMLKGQDELASVHIRTGKWIPPIKEESSLHWLAIVTTPGAIADVAAALQTLPGASPAGNQTGLDIHGGTPNETKAYIDGMLVKNAFGSNLPDIANRSRFSAFIFDQTTFTTTGYSAEYGQALSSSFFMNTNGLTDQISSTAISMISLGEGVAHTERFKNSSLVVSANYYNFSLNNRVVHQNTLWKKDPLQYHSMINYKLKTSETGLLKVLVDYSDTRLSFKIDNPQKDSLDLLVNNNRNLYFNANYNEYLGADWQIFAGISYNYTLETGLDNTDPYNQKDNAWEQKITLSKPMGSMFKFSTGVEQYQTGREESYTTLKRQYSDVLSAAFAEEQIRLTSQVILKAGVRGEYSGYMKKGNIAPRTILSYTINPKNILTAEYGIYYEKPDDSFLAQTSQLNYEQADNYSLQYDFKLAGRSLGVQTYYKNYHDLVKITTPVFSGFQAYGPPVYISSFSNKGYGYAKGVDILWKDWSTLHFGQSTEYYVAYSYDDTKRNYIDYPDAAQPPFAPKHTANFVMHSLFRKPNIQLAVTYTFSSGRTYFDPKNPVFMGNTTRDYNSLSTGISRAELWGKKKKTFALMNFSVNNILGFNQVYGYRFSYDGSRSTPILPPGKRQFVLSLLVNFNGGDINF